MNSLKNQHIVREVLTIFLYVLFVNWYAIHYGETAVHSKNMLSHSVRANVLSKSCPAGEAVMMSLTRNEH